MHAEAFGKSFGPAVVIGIGMGQRDRGDGTATRRNDLEATFERRTGRIAGVHEHEPALTEEVGTDRLACDAASGRHDDAHDVGRGLIDHDVTDTSRREAREVRRIREVFELLERRARREPQADEPIGHGVERVRRTEPLERHDLATRD